jgi:hypothetical protein
MQGLGLSDLAGKAALTKNMVSQAYLLASIDIFYLSAWLSLLAVALTWLCHRVRVAAAAAYRCRLVAVLGHDLLAVDLQVGAQQTVFLGEGPVAENHLHELRRFFVDLSPSTNFFTRDLAS